MIFDRAESIRRGQAGLLGAALIGFAAFGVAGEASHVGAVQAANYYVVAGTSGSGSTPSDTGTEALSTKLNSTTGIAIDPEGNLLIADRAHSAIEVVAESDSNPGYLLAGSWQRGDLYLLAGDASGSTPTPSSDLPGLDARLILPEGVSVDPDGNVLIADTGDDEIEVLAENSALPPYDIGRATWTRGNLYVIAGGGSVAPSSSGFSAVGTLLNHPGALAVDTSAPAHGDLLIADSSDNEVELLADTTGNPGDPALPSTLTFGDLYVVAGGALSNPPDACGSGDLNTTLNDPGGVAVDTSGNIVVADSGNDEVEVLGLSASNPDYAIGSGAVWTRGEDFVVAGSGSHSSGSRCPLAQATALDDPRGVALDTSGDVIVADTASQVVRAIAVSGVDPGYSASNTWVPGFSYVLAGGGATNASVMGSVASLTGLSEPDGVAALPNGAVYVADAGTSEVGELLSAPNNPTGVVAIASDGSVAVSWSPPSVDGGSPVSGFRVIESSVGSVSPTAIVETESGSAFQDVVGLTDGTTYEFTVSAENSIGVGPPSPPVLATPEALQPSPTGSISPPPPASSEPGVGGVIPTPTPSPIVSTPPNKSGTTKKPAIRLATPMARVSKSGVQLELVCSGVCRGIAELTETIGVGVSTHRILVTKVLGYGSYRLSTPTPRAVVVPLTSSGRAVLRTLRRPLVLGQVLTVKGGKTENGHVRLLPPPPSKPARPRGG